MVDTIKEVPNSKARKFSCEKYVLCTDSHLVPRGGKSQERIFARCGDCITWQVKLYNPGEDLVTTFTECMPNAFDGDVTWEHFTSQRCHPDEAVASGVLDLSDPTIEYPITVPQGYSFINITGKFPDECCGAKSFTNVFQIQTNPKFKELVFTSAATGVGTLFGPDGEPVITVGTGGNDNGPGPIVTAGSTDEAGSEYCPEYCTAIAIPVILGEERDLICCPPWSNTHHHFIENLLGHDDAKVAKMCDWLNCGNCLWDAIEAATTAPELDIEAICDLVIEKFGGPELKAAIVACLTGDDSPLTKDLLGQIIQGT